MSRRDKRGPLPRRLMRPTFETKKPLVARPVPAPPDLQARLLNQNNAYLACYRLGECSVIVTAEFGQYHLSIAHQERYPTWDEVAEARYRFVPENLTMAMLLPPRADWVNLHENCFQLVEIDDPAQGRRTLKGEPGHEQRADPDPASAVAAIPGAEDSGAPDSLPAL